MSMLAVAALACGSLALLSTCLHGGMLGVCAVVLGMVALDRIRKAERALRGRGMAIAGIWLGSASAVLGAVVVFVQLQVASAADRSVESALRTTFAAVDGPGAKAAIDHWAPGVGKSIRSEDIASFATEVHRRYGAYSGFTEFGRRVDANFGEPVRATIDVSFNFERKSVLGTIVTRQTLDLGRQLVEPRIESLQMLDPTGEVLGIPPHLPDAPSAPVADGGPEQGTKTSDEGARREEQEP